jgi:hypothetical protein
MLDLQIGPPGAEATAAWPTTANGLPLALRDEDIARLIDRSVFTVRRWRKLKRLPPKTVGPYSSRDAVLAHLGLLSAAA